MTHRGEPFSSSASSSSSSSSSSLFQACKLGNTEQAKRIIEASGKIEDIGHVCRPEGTTPLLTAALNEHWTLVFLLLDMATRATNGAPVAVESAVNARTPTTNNTLLHLAAKTATQKDVFRLLTHKGVKGGSFPNVDRDTPLHFYCRRFSTVIDQTIEEFATRSPASISFANTDGLTPLHIACDMGHYQIAEKLVACGADVNFTDAGGETPLHFAVSKNFSSIASLLVSTGARTDVVGMNGSPFELATTSKMISILQNATTSKTPSPSNSSGNNTAQGFMEIDPRHLDFFEQVGYGGSGLVYRGSHKGKEVAIKVVRKGLTTSEYETFAREVSFLSQLKHPKIMTLVGACLHPNNMCLLTEYMKNGNLGCYLTSHVDLCWSRRYRFALDIAQGMLYLHSQEPPVLHRDLKSINVLIDDNLHARLADFGLSRQKRTENMNRTPGAGYSLSWASPELIEGRRQTEKSDVYSYGVILWEIATCKHPYAGLSDLEVINALFEGSTKLEIPPDIHVRYSCIIEKCLCYEQSLRPEFVAIASGMKTLLRDHRRGVSEPLVSDSPDYLPNQYYGSKKNLNDKSGKEKKEYKTEAGRSRQSRHDRKKMKESLTAGCLLSQKQKSESSTSSKRRKSVPPDLRSAVPQSSSASSSDNRKSASSDKTASSSPARRNKAALYLEELSRSSEVDIRSKSPSAEDSKKAPLRRTDRSRTANTTTNNQEEESKHRTAFGRSRSGHTESSFGMIRNPLSQSSKQSPAPPVGDGTAPLSQSSEMRIKRTISHKKKRKYVTNTDVETKTTF